MSGLAELQRGMQRYVVAGEPAILDAVNSSVAVSAETRLDVYFNAYRARLIEALGGNMPRLQQLLGDEAFAALARQYIDAHPSTFTSVRWFGDRLVALLEQIHPEQPWLAELAHWEWAIAAAFDAQDAEPCCFDALAALAPEEWAELRLQFHASVRVLDLTTNAAALFKTLTDEQPVPEPALLEQPQPWLIWRESLATQYRSLEANEAAALRAALGGATFATLCEILCEWHAEDAVPMQAAGMLKRWMTDELVIGATA